MRFHLRHLLFAVAMAAGLAWSIRIGMQRTQHNIEASRSTYAARLVAQMCVRHLQSNQLAWPRNWEELRDEFDPCLARSGQTWTFEDLQERVAVDWNWDAKARHDETPDSPADPIIWVASDPDFRFYGMTPSDIVLGYLQSPAAQPFLSHP